MSRDRKAGPLVCILNSTAHSDAALSAKEALIEGFARRGVELDVLVARSGGDIPDLCREAKARAPAVIIAGGGDGTINAVAGVCVESGIPLGVLPLGTLNHFAKDMGIPLQTESAVETLLGGNVVHVDVGEVNGKLFLNNSSVGLYPSIVREREKWQRNGDSKGWAFLKAGMDVFRRYPHLRVTLEREEGGEVTTETPFVFIGNSRYECSGLRIGSRDCLDDGLLWVYHAPHATRGTLIRLALQAVTAAPASGELQVFSSASCKITAEAGSLSVSTDGEVCRLSTPLCYQIRPKALKVIAPDRSTD